MGLDLDLVSGSLILRDAEEPAPLATPTTFDATVDDATGAITAGTFAVAPLTFSYPVEDFEVTADIKATFTQLAPATGLVSAEHNVTVDVRFTVDLDITIRGTELAAKCKATPIDLRLASSTPYDPDTGRVTVADDFSIPAIDTADPCGTLIGSRVDDLLSGGGHRIEMVLQGSVPRPKIGFENTTTTLTASPGQTRAGDEVTLTADVTPEDTDAGTPLGVVEFLDGANPIGSVPIDSNGVAVLTTSTLPEGSRQLTARYLGDETFKTSTSTVVVHLVAASPTIDVALAETLVIGGSSRTARITIANPATDGADIANTRLDLTLTRTDPGYGHLSAPHVVLEWRDGDTWKPVTLTPVGGNVRGVKATVGPVQGFALPAGTEREILMRFSAPNLTGPASTLCFPNETACPGPIELTLNLPEVDPATGAIDRVSLSGTTHDLYLVETTRRPTTLALLFDGPIPHTVRQGYSLEVFTVLDPVLTGNYATGSARILIDGHPAPARLYDDPFDEERSDELPLVGGSFQAQVLLPLDIEVGEHVLTVRYLGDRIYGPSEVSARFTVLPALGTPFVCQGSLLPPSRSEFGAQVTFAADVPAVAVAGSAVELGVPTATVRLNRPPLQDPFLAIADGETTVSADGLLRGLSFGLGDVGGGSAVSLTRENGSLLFDAYPADESAVDQVLTLNDATASITLEGAPGDVVPVEVDEIVIDMMYPGLGIPIPVTCVPLGDPVVLGEVEIAGVSVRATPSPAREVTDDVTIEAQTFPAAAAGTVSFSSDRDGSLGSDGVDAGEASVVAADLSPGTHVITASFNATDPGVPDTQGTVTVEVIPSPETPVEAFVTAALIDFTGTASEADVTAGAKAITGGQSRAAYLAGLARSDAWLGRVVNELYLDTLGRPGDPDGVAYWIGRLRAGSSVARVAANFYGSGEYYAKRGGTPETYVDALYTDLLNRVADPDGRAYWIEQAAIVTRGGIALRFLQTREVAGARVGALYEVFLKRTPNATDRGFWAQRMISRGDLAVTVDLAASAEYYRRATTRYPLI